MTPTPSPDPVCPNCGASYSLPLGVTCDDHRPAAAGEGTERPDTDAEQLRAAADWFDTFDKMGRAFFAFLARSTMSDEMRAGAEALIPTFDGDEVQTDLRRIADRLDALTPQPPVPPQGTERPDTAALLTIGDWLLRTLPGHQGAEQTAAALAYTVRWIDAQPPVPPTPAPQADSGLLLSLPVVRQNGTTGKWHASDDHKVTSCGLPLGTALACASSLDVVDDLCGNCFDVPTLRSRLAATAPSAPVERPQPDGDALYAEALAAVRQFAEHVRSVELPAPTDGEP